MPQQLIFLGTTANDRTGTDWRAGGDIINDNFTELYAGLFSNLIPITQESDFPVQDASTITQEAGKVYCLQNDLTTAKSVICEDGSVYTAFNQRGVTHTYTGSGDAFSGTDANYTIEKMGVSCTNSSARYFNFVETVGGTKVFVVNFCGLSGPGKIGTFNNMGAVNFIESSALLVDDGITFVGTQTVVANVSKFFITSTNTSFVAIDLGAAVSAGWDFGDLQVNAPSGAIGISGLASSGNVPVGGTGMVDGGSFSGGVTPLNNIASNDVRWEISGNPDIADSRNAADVYLTGGTETITVSAAGDWYEIGVPGTGGVSWASDIADRFTVGTDGVITYVGEKDIEVAINGRATVAKSGGGANLLEVRIAKNWTGAVTDSGLEKSRAETQNAAPTTVPIGALIPLIQNDNIRAIFSNTNGTSNILASVSSLSVSE